MGLSDRLTLLVLPLSLSLVACAVRSNHSNPDLPDPTVSSDDDDVSGGEDSEPLFELLGTWNYTGGFAGLTNMLDVSEGEFLDTGDYQGSPWVIRFSILSWDNDADQAQLETAETEGFSHYAVGDMLYSSWLLDGDSLRLYTSPDGFVASKGGSEGDEFFTYTRSE